MNKFNALVTALCVIGSAAAAQTRPFHFEFEELAAGVWTGIQADSPRFPVMGNVTFVIANEGVVVYDFDTKHVIQRSGRRIELLHLGDGNSV